MRQTMKRMEIGRAVVGGFLMGLVVLLAMLLSTVFSGCAFNRQYATTTSTNPTNGQTTVTLAKSTTYAIGDAKAIVGKERASAGKTSSVGASGINEETTSTNVLNMFERIGKAVLAVP